MMPVRLSVTGRFSLWVWTIGNHIAEIIDSQSNRLFPSDEFPVQPAVIRTPRREPSTLLIKLKGEVDVCFAVQQIVEVQTRSLQMHSVDLEISPVEGAVGVVMVDLAFALWILRPLNCEGDPAVGAKFPASVLLPGR